MRKQTFKEDFDTAVKPHTASIGVRALSSYAIRPQSWSGYLSHDSSAGGGREMSQHGAKLREQHFARDPQMRLPKDLQAVAKAIDLNNGSSIGVSTSKSQYVNGHRDSYMKSVKSVDGNVKSGGIPFMSSVASMLQRSLLMPTSRDSVSLDEYSAVAKDLVSHPPPSTPPIPC